MRIKLWFAAVLLAGCTPVVWISDDGGDLIEPNGQCVVTVHRDDAGRSPVTVNLSYEGAESDYVGAVRSVTVEPGQYSSRSFTLSAVDDDLVEPEKLLNISIVPSEAYQIGEQASVLIAVTSDDEDEPPPPDVPWASPGLSVLILREGQSAGTLSPEQRAIFNSVTIHEWLTKNCVRLSDGQPGYRIWDNDVDPSNAPMTMQLAFRAVKAHLKGEEPLIGISTGTSGIIRVLPPNVDETITLLEKYK